MKGKVIVLLLILMLTWTCIVFTNIVPALAQDRVVGANVGFWIQYGISVTWESNDPNATTPQYILDAQQTEFHYLVVQRTSGTNITFDIIVHFRNGTEKFDTYSIDVDTGKGTGYLYFISANLSAGDMIYTWPPGQGNIDETITRTYLGEAVEVNHANGTTSNGYFMYFDIYWNRETGVLYEYYMNHTTYTTKGKETYATQETIWLYPIGVIGAARTWTVDDDGPADFHTIQEAINAASPGDTILVSSGTYYERVVVNKTVSLIGEDKYNTIIDGNYNGTVIEVTASNVVIEDLTAQNGERGIFLRGTRNITLTRNDIRNNQYNFLVVGPTGPDPQYFTHNIDSSNTVDEKPVYYWVDVHNDTIPQDAGFAALVNSTNITVQNLSLSNNGEGLLLVNTNASRILGNDINKCLVGLAFGMCYNNTIVSNTISNSQFYCYNFYGFANNVLYHNNFLNSSLFERAEMRSNTWDDGYPSGGNYWSDYEERYPEAKELDDSGVWDTPYAIDEDNKDNYPLMEPWTPRPPVGTSLDLVKRKAWPEHRHYAISKDEDKYQTLYGLVKNAGNVTIPARQYKVVWTLTTSTGVVGYETIGTVDLAPKEMMTLTYNIPASELSMGKCSVEAKCYYYGTTGETTKTFTFKVSE